MSKRDVNKIFVQTELAYFEMLKEVKDFDKEFKAGNISKEQLDQFNNMLTPLKNNYFTIALFMKELDKPQRKSKWEKYEYDNSDISEFLEDNKVSVKNFVDENTRVLKDFKSYVKKFRKEQNNG